MEEVKNLWVVHKFGGTSVSNSKCMKSCIQIIKDLHLSRVAVVVSAMGGKPKVTDLLLETVNAAATTKLEHMKQLLQLIHEKHQVCVTELFHNDPDTSSKLLTFIESDLSDIKEILKAVSLIKVAHEQILELVSGYGEIWSARILSELFKQEGMNSIFLNAREILTVEENQYGQQVLWGVSEEKLSAFIERNEINSVSPVHLVITGYIASTAAGVATTLKRDGSDYTASIFGKMLNASAVTIWTDVSGVFSADPRRVPEAQIIPEISYSEAIELAYFGAKIIHPKTMAPAIQAQIPIYIRNTFQPEHEGTRIFVRPSRSSMRERSVCGFTTVDGVCLVNLIGNGLLGISGIAHRLFGALKACRISVLFIAQASAEHNICFGTHEANSSAARQAIEEAFLFEVRQGMVSIRTVSECSIIAAVGESMNNMPGVSGIFFGALGDASINVLSISQGCDERNLAAVVYSRDATRALRAVHSAFCLSSLEISIGLIGTGKVGSSILQLLVEQTQMLEKRFNLSLKVRGVINSRMMVLGEDLGEALGEVFTSPPTPKGEWSGLRRSNSNLSLQTVSRVLSSMDPEGAKLEQFIEHVRSGVTPHAIIIDASTSSEVAEQHPRYLARGLHVVTANKRALATTLSLFNEVYSAVREHNKMYLSEVTIGAALPIRTTLHDLLYSGDAIRRIEGLMSCTAGFLLTEICDNGLSFSQAVSKTYLEGLFEVDPFQDLEGTEAAQKLLVMAREMGAPLSLDQVEIEPLARRREVCDWSNLADEFREEDEYLAGRAREAAGRGCTLRYVQRIDCDPPAEMGLQSASKIRASVRLEEVPSDSTHARVRGAIYHFSFHTARYSQHPLIVQGPLSDAANTASGIVGDVLRIARSMGARDRGPETSRPSDIP